MLQTQVYAIVRLVEAAIAADRVRFWFAPSSRNELNDKPKESITALMILFGEERKKNNTTCKVS